jgi:parallel beta-helix repeat protein
MVQKFLKVRSSALIIAVFLFLGIGTYAVFATPVGTPITDCVTIASSGPYVLSNDITATTTCIVVSVSDVTINGNGYSLIGDSESGDNAIQAEDVTGLAITNINIQSFGDGIRFDAVASSTITDVTVSGSHGSGIHLIDSNDNQISGVAATSSANGGEFTGYGLYLLDSSNNEITDSDFSDNSGSGVVIYRDSDANSITDSTFTHNNYSIDINGCPFEEECSNTIDDMTVSGNTMTDPNQYGVYLSLVQDSTFTENIISEADVAFNLEYQDVDNTFTENNIENSNQGILLDDESTGNTFSSNILTGVSTGVYIASGSDGNTIDSNVMEDMGTGFYIDDSDDNVVTNNSITISDVGYGDGSSSPLLFTWNGDKYDYIADVGRGIPRNMVGTDYVSIPKDKMVAQGDNYNIKISQEYNEIVYYDELALTTLDHAPGIEVVTSLQRNKEGEFFTIDDTPSNPLESCVDMYGHDCLEDLQASDERWSYKDESNLNSWVMDFGDLSGASRIQLVIESARDYSITSADLKQIQVKNSSGEWVNAYSGSAISSPAGAPRRQVIDLTGKFLTDDYSVRFGYDRTRVNYVAIDTSTQQPFTENTYYPTSADLQFHGYTNVDKQFFWDHNYDEVSPRPFESFAPQTGMFTKYGDVSPLLDDTDDQFVIMHHGDQMDINFDYVAPASGTERSFVLFNWATFKHAKMGEVGETVEPLPYDGMTAYPYTSPQEYPMTEENANYLKTWNTRKVDAKTYAMSFPDSTNTTVSGNTIVNDTEEVGRGDVGIHMQEETDSLIDDNEVAGFDYGILIEYSEGITITNNIVRDTVEDAIKTNQVDNLVISNNTISDADSSSDGIEARYGVELTITDNNISETTDDGIFIRAYDGAIVTGNTISAVDDNGIDFEDSSNYTIEDNTISSVSNGIDIEGEYDESDDDCDDPTSHCSLRQNFLDNATPEYFNGNSSGWVEKTADLGAFVGDNVNIGLVYTTDGSVLVDGVYVDDIIITVDGTDVVTDDIEGGVNGWTVDDPYGPNWEITDVGDGANSGSNVWYVSSDDSQYTSLNRNIDLTTASTVSITYWARYDTEGCCDHFGVLVGAASGDDDIVVEPSEAVNTVTDNDITSIEGYGAVFDGAKNVTFLHNIIRSDYWVDNDDTSNVFSDSSTGNTYYFADGTPAWETYDIKDSDKNGYADEGEGLPFNSTTLTGDIWYGDGQDEHPATETTVASRKKGGSVVSRVKALNGFGMENRAKELKEQFPNVFDDKGSSDSDSTKSTFSRNLDKGASGDDVRNLQKFLNGHGFPIAPTGPGSNGNETDLFGELTRIALAKFQAANGISPAIGFLGPLTRDFIAKMGGDATSPTTSTPTAPQADTNTLDLESGMTGDNVLKLQKVLIAVATGPAAEALKNHGATNLFGPLTKSALVEYQKANGLPATGFFGPKTREKMKNAGIAGLWW